MKKKELIAHLRGQVALVTRERDDAREALVNSMRYNGDLRRENRTLRKELEQQKEQHDQGN